MVNIGVPELLIVLGTLLPLVFGIWALIDVARRSDAQFAQAGQSRMTWLIVAVLSLLVPCVFLGAAYYLFAIRPKLPPRGAA